MSLGYDGCLIAESPEAGGVISVLHRSLHTPVFQPPVGWCTLEVPLVPLKLGVFQELRDAIVTGEPYQAHGWFIARQNPVHSLPDRQKTLEAFNKMDFIVTVDIIMNDTGLVLGCGLARGVLSRTLRPIGAHG